MSSNWKPWEDPDFKYSYESWDDPDTKYSHKTWEDPDAKYSYEYNPYPKKRTYLPTNQNPKWTMCADGLPSPHQDVIACDEAGAMEIGRVFRAQCGSDFDFFVENDYTICYGIIAWMPLPIPPKGV